MSLGPDRREVLHLALGLPSIGLGGGATFAAPLIADPVLQSGVSLELARRRATQVSRVRYDLALDLTAADVARGHVTIGFDRRPRSGDLVLDFRGPLLAELEVNGKATPAGRRVGGHLVVPAAVLRMGTNAISARFETPIAASGAPIIRFHDDKDGLTYLYTLLVPSDANLLFPCFDQPDLKARFRWRITAPSDWTVLTNGLLEGRERAGAADRWSFAPTAPISTYLAAFAAGPWETWTSNPASERPITFHARRSRKAEVDADAQIATNRAAVGWLSEWFGIPYPFAKFDLLLAPAFPFSGMEHVGAIFYGEARFVFRERPTLPQQLSRDRVIYHEVSHQWFGDLVTMRWFDDLWLKEGFASYMATRIQADLQPASDAWTTFLLSVKTDAYQADATSGTAPLSQPLANLDAAKGNYGPIVYNKAPAVIKQLAFLVGEDGFRRGLRLFLTRHAYANATWRDLLGAIGEAAGVDLAAFGRQYVLRAGLPRVDTRLTISSGRIEALSLVQRPARELPGDPGGVWLIRTRVRLGRHGGDDEVFDVRMDGEVTTLPQAVGLPAPDYVLANDEDLAYGLFIPDQVSVAWIAEHVGGVGDPLRRALLWNALWDVMRDLKLPPARFLTAMLGNLASERNEQISRTNLARAATALDVYLTEPRSAPLRPAWEAALLQRMEDPRLGYGLRKDALDRLIATARTPSTLDRLRGLLAGSAMVAGEAVRQPTRWAIVRRLVAVGAPDSHALLASERRLDQSSEATKDAFVTAAAAPAMAAKAEYFRRYFNDKTLNEAWVSESLGAFNVLDQANLTLPFLRPALERLEWIRQNRRIFFLPNWVDAFIGGQVSADALATIDAFLAGSTALPADIRRKVLLARDELDVAVRIRERWAHRSPTES